MTDGPTVGRIVLGGGGGPQPEPFPIDYAKLQAALFPESDNCPPDALTRNELAAILFRPGHPVSGRTLRERIERAIQAGTLVRGGKKPILDSAGHTHWVPTYILAKKEKA